MKMLLILGGYINYEWAAEFYKANSYDKVIAVDGGLSAANLLNIYPDSIIGDFDTVSSELVDKYEKENKSTIIRLNPIKDDTDTQYAIKHAMSIGAKEIHIIGGTGGRFDHCLANVFMLKMAYE
ncbi:MAG: thiamine diphosphokinase, partial [Lachnospiraceae bacterium]|nr:thiamine diphosphokinase [Lachnospiraceae bacterium]